MISSPKKKKKVSKEIKKKQLKTEEKHAFETSDAICSSAALGSSSVLCPLSSPPYGVPVPSAPVRGIGSLRGCNPRSTKISMKKQNQIFFYDIELMFKSIYEVTNIGKHLNEYVY